MKYRTTNRRMKKCMRVIMGYCEEHDTQTMSGSELKTLCSDPRNLRSLHALNSRDEIELIIPDGTTIPVAVNIEKKGLLFFYVAHEKLVASIKGFIAGVLTAFLGGWALPHLVTLLSSLQ